jgi:hypothetical protein
MDATTVAIDLAKAIFEISRKAVWFSPFWIDEAVVSRRRKGTHGE